MRRLIEPLASLRLTVTLLTLAMMLIFVGTIAQTTLGVWQAVDAYFRSWVAMVDPGLFVASVDLGPVIPIPGGLTITALLIVNLLAAHAMRFKMSRKRIGILVLHAGLIVLLAGELVTGFAADEGLMSIDEGSSSSVVEDIREAELAFIDQSHAEHDRIVTIPQRMLARAAVTGKPIVTEELPFEVRVEAWYPNAALFHAHGDARATAGIGLEARAEPKPRVAGADGSRADTPAAYITLLRDGTPLGTWMVSAALTEAQRIGTGDAVYGLALRYRRGLPAVHDSSEGLPPRYLHGDEHRAELLERHPYCRPRARHGPRNAHLDEQSAALPGPDLLPGVVQARRLRHGAPGRAESRVAHALHRLRAGRRGHDRPLRDEPDRVSPP
jgi:hypothetical protein